MKHAKILEIFRSIQGEGKYTGVTQVFVRFFECNMHCVWCDTPHSIGDTTRKFDEQGIDEAVRGIDDLWEGCHSVSLTGGEPLLQKDFIKTVLPRLKESNKTVYLETNGTLPRALEEVIDGIDIIAMDIKLPSSTRQKKYWREHEEFLKIARRKDVFIKTVITNDTHPAEVRRAAAMTARFAPEALFILQPNYFELREGVIRKCEEFLPICREHLRDVRIMPQMHKILKVR